MNGYWDRAGEERNRGRMGERGETSDDLLFFRETAKEKDGMERW